MIFIITLLNLMMMVQNIIDGLLFYKVDEFQDSLKQIDKGELENKKLYLTRDNLPKKIFGIHRKHRNYEFEEIIF